MSWIIHPAQGGTSVRPDRTEPARPHTSDPAGPHAANEETWAAPCAEDPTAWDLDTGTLGQWLAALRQCVGCPVLDECVALRDEFFPDADSTHRAPGNPNGVIWAGIAYSDSGVPLDGRGLRLYAARRRRRTELPATSDSHSHRVAAAV